MKFAAACLIVCAASPAFADVIYTDHDMNNADWGMDVVQGDNGGTADQSQSSIGNPGTSRMIMNTVNAGPSSVNAFSRYGLTTATRFVPAVDGAILSIDFSIDARFFAGVGGQGHGLSFGAKQGTFIYTAGYVTTGSSGFWESFSFTGLTAADFTALNGGPGIDFSASAAPLRFGFIASNSSTGGGYSNTVLYDNYSTTVHTVPAPASLGVLGGLALAARRRRR